jgi:hypothetical protein
VDVEEMVGSSRLIKVSVGTGVEVELPEIGVSGTDVSVEAGVAAVRWDGRLQDDIPRITTRLAIQKRFLILSSFSIRIVIAGWIIGNSLAVDRCDPTEAPEAFIAPWRRALKF